MAGILRSLMDASSFSARMAQVRRRRSRRRNKRIWLFLRRFFLLGPRSGENANHGLIRLVARVFVDLSVCLLQRNHELPGHHPRRRVIERDLVVDFMRPDASEAFDDVAVVVWSPDVMVRG